MFLIQFKINCRITIYFSCYFIKKKKKPFIQLLNSLKQILKYRNKTIKI